MASVRFRPPPIAPTPELTWLLRAAFAKTLPELPDSIRPSAVRELAHRLGLAAVIGARLAPPADAGSVPADLVREFRKAQAQSAIRVVLLERAARQVAEVACGHSTPLVFLKGFALYLSGRDRAGGRAIGDLDLLTSEEGAKILHADLTRLGFVSEGGPGNEHHLAVLVSPEGASVDLHFCLRGLSFAGPAWATWEDLDRHHELVAVEHYPGDCTVPTRSVLTAHLLAHGLAHHIWRPQTYPLLQLVADLQELLPDDNAWRSFLSDCGDLLSSVRAAEIEAMRQLALRLHAGRVPNLAAEQPGDDALLLRHILAGYLDREYTDRLRKRHVLGRLADAARQGRLGHYLARRMSRNR